MKKKIEIDEANSIEINSSLGWLFCYREQFGHDILPDLLPLLDAALGAMSELYDNEEDVDLIEKLDEETVSRIIVALSSLEIMTIINITWAMARNAGESRSPEEWANAFETFPLDVILPQLFTVLVQSTVSTKNSQSLLAKIPNLLTYPQSQSGEPQED